MSIRGRDTLKKYFAAGELPRQEHFEELIESVLHMDDEGFRKSPDRGLHITSEVGNTALVTFFRKEDARQPLWTLQHGQAGGQLKLMPGSGEATAATAPPPTLLTLDARQRVGIGTEQPQHALHVHGVVAGRGRAGTWFQPDPKNPPRADGAWHVLARELRGCVAFEIVASASLPGQGRHAVMHAMALNAHNPTLRWFDRWFSRKKRIRCHNAWYGQRCDRLELQWQPQPGAPAGTYQLAIRTQCDYGQPVEIRVHMTCLWPLEDAVADGPGSARDADGAAG